MMEAPRLSIALGVSTPRLASVLAIVLSIAATIAAASTPTNDGAAFRRFDLYADRTTALNATDHVNIFFYPSGLDSDSLLVARSPGDTVGLFDSEPYDAITLRVNDTATESFVEYAVTPRQYATSLGLLAMATPNVFNSTGAFDDLGKLLLTVLVRYADGDSVLDSLRVGDHLRSYGSGSTTCGSPRPFYTTAPSDSLCGPVYLTGLISPETVYSYDVQELRLPVEKWSKKLASIRLSARLLDHVCFSSFHLYAGTNFHGMSVWPNFTVRNAEGQPVVRLSQSTNNPHGGYLFGSGPVGTRRRTNDTACQVASMAMCYTYAGFPCTVDSLNAHLQRHQGYEPSNVCNVTWVSPTGDAIRYRAYTQDNTRLKTNDLFLVERGYYTNPLATFRVTTAGQAVLIRRHNFTTPVIRTDVGRVYWNMKRRVADTYFQNPRPVTMELKDSPELAAQVESLLVRNIPVALNLATPGHMVVADGWVPSFRPGGRARGTYPIKDPFDDRNFTRLIESRVINGRPRDYGNQFRLARYVVPPGGSPLSVQGASTAAINGTASLSVLTDGAWRVELTDPLGRRMVQDAGSGEEASEIPGAWIIEVDSEHDHDEDWDGQPRGFSMDVGQALDGHYTLQLFANEGHALNVSAYDESGIFTSDAAGDTSVAPMGTIYDLHYSAADRTIAVTWLSSVGAQTPAPRSQPSRLAVRGNPATGPVEFLLSSGLGAGDAIEIFDTSGRRVDVVGVAPGRQAASWHRSRAGCQPGVYLARLRSGSGAVRFVVVR